MSELHLWRAVIAQALDDATSKRSDGRWPADRREARAWFKRADADFVETCALAGLDPESVREHALDLIGRRPIEPEPPPRPKRASRPGKRKSIEFDGLNLTIDAWSERTGICPMTIHQRLFEGWSVERTLTEPVRRAEVSNPQ